LFIRFTLFLVPLVRTHVQLFVALFPRTAVQRSTYNLSAEIVQFSRAFGDHVRANGVAVCCTPRESASRTRWRRAMPENCCAGRPGRIRPMPGDLGWLAFRPQTEGLIRRIPSFSLIGGRFGSCQWPV